MQVAGGVQDSSAVDTLKPPPKTHTLIKTDKRRYCKVCAASMRKANNGRPPQSRYVVHCSNCKCRCCISNQQTVLGCAAPVTDVVDWLCQTRLDSQYDMMMTAHQPLC